METIGARRIRIRLLRGVVFVRPMHLTHNEGQETKCDRMILKSWRAGLGPHLRGSQGSSGGSQVWHVTLLTTGTTILGNRTAVYVELCTRSSETSSFEGA